MNLTKYYIPLLEINQEPPFTSSELKELHSKKNMNEQIRNFNSLLNDIVSKVWNLAGSGAPSYLIDINVFHGKNLPSGALQILIEKLSLIFPDSIIKEEIKQRKVQYTKLQTAIVEDKGILVDWSHSSSS